MDKRGRIIMIDEQIRLALLDVGLDADTQISRFMDSEEMFVKFYKGFFTAADAVVTQLETAVEKGDTDTVIHAAHSLKGLAGNIGLYGVYDPSKKIVDDLRAGYKDEYKSDFDKAYGAYTAALSVSRLM